jgi:replicative DNA helicase
MNAPSPRELPHDSQAEYGVIGSMIAGGPTVIEEMRSLLSMEAFYLPAGGQMFGMICNLQASGVPADMITLTAELRNANLLEDLRGEIDADQAPYQGAAFITRLFTFVPTAANAGHYADIVREKFMLRRMLEVCTTAARRCYEDQDAAAAVLDELQSEVIEIGQLTKSIESLQPIGATVPEALAQLKATYKNRGHRARDLERLCRPGPND